MFSLSSAALAFIGFYEGLVDFFDWSVGDLDGDFFAGDSVTLLLVVLGGDGSGVVIRNESSIAKLIGKWFGSSNEVIKILKFGATSLNDDANAMAARFLCLWRFDQWDERIVLRDGVR